MRFLQERVLVKIKIGWYSNLINFLNNLGMLPIWVLQMLIGYSTFLKIFIWLFRFFNCIFL